MTLARAIALAWVVAIWGGIIVVTARVIIPGILNLQNDGALILAPLLAMAVGTAAVVTFVKVLKEPEE